MSDRTKAIVLAILALAVASVGGQVFQLGYPGWAMPIWLACSYLLEHAFTRWSRFVVAGMIEAGYTRRIGSNGDAATYPPTIKDKTGAV